MRVFAATLQHAFVSDRMARAKDVLSSYRVELRQVLKDVGKFTSSKHYTFVSYCLRNSCFVDSNSKS